MELEIMLFETGEDWEEWLDANHKTSSGIWLKIVKKGADKTSPSYSEALDVALCFGWIDSQKGKFDDDFYLQRFTPRRRNSKWSQINVDKATALIEQGKMRASGMHEVEMAKSDGRWDAAYLSQSNIKVPDDLQKALDDNESARDFFNTLDSANRYAILYRVTTAKKTETRKKRIKQFVDMLAKGEKIHN